jgi:hypothetical protein
MPRLQRHLANLGGTPLRTLARTEAGEVLKPRGTSMKRLAASLRDGSVEFAPSNGGGPGVRQSHEAALREAVTLARAGEPTPKPRRGPSPAQLVVDHTRNTPSPCERVRLPVSWRRRLARVSASATP